MTSGVSSNDQGGEGESESGVKAEEPVLRWSSTRGARAFLVGSWDLVALGPMKDLRV